MTNRREFLEAAALSALTASATTVTAAPPAASPEFHLVLFDQRYPQARNVAARIGRAGAAVHALTNGDVTQIWLEQIGPAWRQGPAVIAGFTARHALFCLEQLALSSGLRVVFHAEHVVQPNGRTDHSLLRGAESLQLSAADLSQAGRHWPARIADALATYRPRAAHPRFGRSEAALDPALPADSQLLTSWIIAAA